MDEKDTLAAEFYDLGTSGMIETDLPEDRCRLQAFFEDDGLAAPLAGKLAPWNPAFEQTENRDWVAESRTLWQPILVGERFFLVPPWRDDPVPPGRIRLEMPSGVASGTGLHPCTRMALEALERSVTPGDCVLDLGTGSGILAAAASHLGAGKVIACDIDPDSARAARHCICESISNIHIYVGSVRSIHVRSINVVAANINAVTLMNLAAEIARVLTPGGRAVLTGFRSTKTERVVRKLETAGLPAAVILEESGWQCLLASKPGYGTKGA